MNSLEDIGIFEDSHDDEDVFDAEANFHNLDFTFQASPIPTTRIHKDHPLEQVIRDLHSAPQTMRMTKNLEEHDFIVYQMDVKSAFLYGKIEEEVYVCQPPRFENPDFPNKVYKVKKALYGLYPLQELDVKKESTPMETSKPLLKDEDGEEVDLVEICRQKELLCMHDNVDDLIESYLNSKLLSINSQRLNKEKQEVKNVMEQPAKRGTRIIESLQNFRVIHKNSTSLKNTSQIYPVHAVAPILSTKKPEYSPSMGYEHPNTTPKTESDLYYFRRVEELVPILSECEVTSEDKRECDMPVCENSPIFDDHSEIFFDSKIDDDISSDDDDFEDIEYVEASLPDPEIVNLEEENVVYHEDINRLIANIKSLNDNRTPNYNSLPEFKTFCDHTEETRSGSTTTHADNSLPEYDSFCFEIEPNQERLINDVKNDIPDDSSNDHLLEKANLFLASDNSIPPGIENFAYDSKRDIRFLEALIIDDSIPFLINESSEFDFDNTSIQRPPLKPPDAEFDFKTDSEEEISVVINTIDELKCLDPRNRFDDDFMFVIYSKMFLSFLSAESEDTIFDPGISV
nr:retrotransposon protein, putative, unclassified [Tanacetum cinerariifolium]